LMLTALILLLLAVQCKGWLSPVPTYRSSTWLRESSSSVSSMESAVVLIDPITDWKQVIDAAASLGHVVIAVQLPAEALPEKFQSFLPTTLALEEAGRPRSLCRATRCIFNHAAAPNPCNRF